jgi:AmmeMemoRadiSam system protein A
MYTAIQRQQMLSIAYDSIQHGLNLGTRIVLDLKKYSRDLQEHRACFVTLEIDELLRGCIGSLIAREPLVENIAYNAHSAAFHDPRFEPLQHDELPLLKISIAILSDSVPIAFSSEQELLEQIHPNIDGLILREGALCSTFLPAVWQQLPDPKDFLRHLKTKAGLDENYWSDSIRAERYRVVSISN